MKDCMLRFFYLIPLLFCVTFIVGCGDNPTLSPDLKNLQISLNQSSLVLEIGSSQRLVASFSPSNTENKAHVWSSDDASIASVDEMGNVTGVAEGTTTITAKALVNGNVAKCQVTVTDKIVHVSSIALNQSETTLVVGESVTLYATISPSNATDKSYYWKTSDKSVATVSETGVVAAVASGTATVSAVAHDGNRSADCFITVVSAGVQLSEPTFSDITTTSATISGTIKEYGKHAEEIGFCYSTSSNPTVESNKVAVNGNNFSYTLHDLAPNTTYYVRLFAKYDGKVEYGANASFETKGILKTQFVPTVIRCNQISIQSPICEGYNRIKICYGTHSNPKVTDNCKEITANSNNLYETTLANLNEGTKYYIRTFQEINGSIIYSDDEVVLETIGNIGSGCYFCYNVTPIADNNVMQNPDAAKSARYTIHMDFEYEISGNGTYSVERLGDCGICNNVSYITAGHDKISVDRYIAYEFYYSGAWILMRLINGYDGKSYGYVVIKDIETGVKYECKIKGYTHKVKYIQTYGGQWRGEATASFSE